MPLPTAKLLSLIRVDGNQLSMLSTSTLYFLLAVFSLFAITTHWTYFFYGFFFLLVGVIGVTGALLRSKALALAYIGACLVCIVVFGLSILYLPFAMTTFSFVILVEAFFIDIFIVVFLALACVGAFFLIKDERSAWKYVLPTMEAQMSPEIGENQVNYEVDTKICMILEEGRRNPIIFLFLPSGCQPRRIFALMYRRSFIWFHHIYSKKKQKAIFRWSKELCLTGMIRTGTPGVVLVEGNSIQVNRFVIQIKALNWQKMTVHATEDIEKPLDCRETDEEWEEAQRKFLEFERHDTDKFHQLLPLFKKKKLENFFYKGSRMEKP